MNKINKDELFSQVSQFLHSKGIELQQGSYMRTIEKGCQLLADTINLSQQAVDRARSEIESKLEHARQVIHEKTAPKQPPVYSDPAATPSSAADSPGPSRRQKSNSGTKPPRIRPARTARAEPSARPRRKGPK
jgi:hypothetical protein